ncbi:phage head-tail joining protein [Tabrizicola sp. M-4]|uniref:phage head-tail joining protein n=1 Tax=Tabrizicola sp. M-4 TaxID=3055847 RepID=UPI003DA84ABE
MATLAQLQEWRDRLKDARFNGLRSVQDSNGERVEYKSDSELARAIAAVESEIAGASRPRQSILYPLTSKGV